MLANITFHRNETPEMIVFVPPMEAGFCLTDPKDPRHKYMTQLKARYGEFLHTASTSLRKQGEENTVDAVHALVRGYPKDLGLRFMMGIGTRCSHLSGGIWR